MGKKDGETKKVEEKTEETKPKLGKHEKPPKPEQPDEKAFNESKQEFEDELDKCREQIKKLSEKINAAQTGKEEYEAQREVLNTDFMQARDKFDELRKKQFELIDQIKQQNQVAKENKRELREMTRELGGEGGEEAIDNKIRELEYKMQTGTHSLKAEKDMMSQIKELKKKKPAVISMARKVEKLSEDATLAEGASKPLDEQIKECRAEIEVAKAEKDVKKAALDKLRDSRQKQRDSVKKEIDAKNALKERMDAARASIKKLRDAYMDKKRAYDNWEWECRKIDRAIREERWAKEQEAWEAEKKKLELEKKNEKPFFDECVLIEQTMTYCNNLLNPSKKAEEEKKKTAADFEDIEGRTILVSKKDREAEMWLAPKGKKLRNKGQQGGSKKNNTIQHNIATFTLFDELSKLGDKKNKKPIAAPLTLADVPAVIEALKEKQAYYDAKIADWQKEMDKLAAEVQEADAKAAADAAETEETKDE